MKQTERNVKGMKNEEKKTVKKEELKDEALEKANGGIEFDSPEKPNEKPEWQKK